MNACRPRCLALFVLLAPSAGLSGADPLAEADKSAREWVNLRVEATRLTTDWQTDRALLESTLAALQEKAALTEEKRDLAKAKTAKDREELDALAEKNRRAAADLAALEARLKTVTAKLIALRPGLPPRLSDALEMTYRSLASPSLPPGERMQLAMNVLNRCAQFNRLITAGEDVLTLDGEPTARSLETIYWGLSHGYAVDRAARKAWLGAPAGGVWRWEAKPEAFEGVGQLLAIAHDKADPLFVSVPAPATKAVAASPKQGTP